MLAQAAAGVTMCPLVVVQLLMITASKPDLMWGGLLLFLFLFGRSHDPRMRKGGGSMCIYVCVYVCMCI